MKGQSGEVYRIMVMFLRVSGGFNNILANICRKVGDINLCFDF